MGKILTTDELFTRINDQLSLCGACGVAVGDEEKHIGLHEALMEIAESHNVNARALMLLTEKHNAICETLILHADVTFDVMIAVSELRGMPAAELEEMTRETKKLLDNMKFLLGTGETITDGSRNGS